MKYCKKCGCDTARYATGRCKPCAKEQNNAYKAKYPERRKATIANWEARNKDKRASYAKKWQTSNRDRAKEITRNWKSSNHDSVLLHNQNRRAKRAQNGGSLSIGLRQRLLKLQRGKCACCGLPLGDDYHLDHIMPLALGGTNTDDNIQLLRATCNLQKKSKHPIDFMRSKGLLL